MLGGAALQRCDNCLGVTSALATEVTLLTRTSRSAVSWEGRVTLVRNHADRWDYNQIVRHYIIKTMHGFSSFTCPLCKHSVTTREFSSQNGSCRTQAARAMNEHAAVAHGRPLPISPGHVQIWHVH